MLDQILSVTFWVSVLSSAINLATPILSAGLGEIITQKSGIMNLGLEGTMLMGALGAFVGCYFSGSLLVGVLCGILVGFIMGAMMGFLSITMRGNQVIAGTALTMLGGGLATFLYRSVFGVSKLPPTVKNFPILEIPFLTKIPVVGDILFRHNLMVYLIFLLVPVTWFLMEKTMLGLKIKAVGEHPKAVESKGLSVYGLRYTSVILGGGYAGLAGAFLTLGYVNVFTDSMVSGRGYIALAVVIFARWKPLNAMWGALLFGFLNGLQTRLQAVGAPIPNQFLAMMPYVITIVVLIIVSRNAEFPAAYTVPYSKRDK